MVAPMMIVELPMDCNCVVLQELREEHGAMVRAWPKVLGEDEEVACASGGTKGRGLAHELPSAALGRDHSPSKSAHKHHNNTCVCQPPVTHRKRAHRKHLRDCRLSA
eukprot:7369052-Prymnesium_polylepis.1